MKDVIDKLGTYNLFNYLLPGCVFCALSEHFGLFKARQDEIVTSLFVYYFVGLVVSRIGSLFIEPLLKKSGFVKYGPYADFVKASFTDAKIETLSEINNMYRTFTAMFASLALLKLWALLTRWLGVSSEAVQWSSILGGLALFAASYRKQSAFVCVRIGEAAKSIIS